MDIIINQQKIQNALRAVERIVSKNISLPILNTILLKTDGGRLRLSATNLEIGINCWVGAKINKPGEIAVPAKVFSDFISNTFDENISLAVDKNIIFLTSENYKTKILGMETKDFPLIPKAKNGAAFKISSANLKGGLMAVLDAASLSETRPEIGGIYVNIIKNKIEFAATDSFRLAEKIINLNIDINKSFIIPRNTAIELVRLSDNFNDDLSLTISDNQLFIYGSDFEFISRLIDGHYPDYKKIIPDKFISILKINKNNLDKNTRLASIFSSSISDIKLKADKNNLQISAQNSDRGEILANIPCLIKNSPFEVAVNYRYLLDGLKLIPSEDVIIHFSGDGSPLVLREEDKKDQTYVIMPLRR